MNIKKNFSKGELGQKGEVIGVNYLLKRNFKIIERRYRKRLGKIDIICIKRGILHFIQVKTKAFNFETLSISAYSKRSSRQENNLTPIKIKKIKHLADIYMDENNIESSNYHIDEFIVYLYYLAGVVKKIQVRYIPFIEIS